MSNIRLVHVDKHGRDKNGDVFDLAATPEMVAGGYMINIPVHVRYPDGRIMSGTEVKITPAGMEKLARELPVDVRSIQGRA